MLDHSFIHWFVHLCKALIYVFQWISLASESAEIVLRAGTINAINVLGCPCRLAWIKQRMRVLNAAIECLVGSVVPAEVVRFPPGLRQPEEGGSVVTARPEWACVPVVPLFQHAPTENGRVYGRRRSRSGPTVERGFIQLLDSRPIASPRLLSLFRLILFQFFSFVSSFSSFVRSFVCSFIRICLVCSSCLFARRVVYNTLVRSSFILATHSVR